MIFNYPAITGSTTAITFTNNPEAPYEKEVIKHNTTIQMEDGSFYVYSRSVTNYRYDISVVLNSEAERNALEDFYDSIVNGSEKTFEYTDPNSDTAIVRFEDRLQIEDIFKGSFYRASFRLIQTA